MNASLYQPLFDIGQVVATPSALRHLETHQVLPLLLLGRHLNGDWGDLGAADKQANDAALISGGRLLSAYAVGDGRIWVITEADHSATTLLLPEEY